MLWVLKPGKDFGFCGQGFRVGVGGLGLMLDQGLGFRVQGLGFRTLGFRI